MKTIDCFAPNQLTACLDQNQSQQGNRDEIYSWSQTLFVQLCKQELVQKAAQRERTTGSYDLAWNNSVESGICAVLVLIWLMWRKNKHADLIDVIDTNATVKALTIKLANQIYVDDVNEAQALAPIIKQISSTIELGTVQNLTASTLLTELTQCHGYKDITLRSTISGFQHATGAVFNGSDFWLFDPNGGQITLVQIKKQSKKKALEDWLGIWLGSETNRQFNRFRVKNYLAPAASPPVK